MDKLTFKSTVTGKRQITIPKEICKLLNIQKGKQVVFEQEGNKIIFKVDSEHKTCFACNGFKKIGNNNCFVCNGTGILDKKTYSDIYKLIGFISINSKVKVDFIYDKDVPTIKLLSNEYQKDILVNIESKIQQLINKQFK